MAYFPDLTTSSPVLSGDTIRAVGWLERAYGYPTGKVTGPSRFLRNLLAIRLGARHAQSIPFLSDSMGTHECDFCSGHHDTGELFVPFGSLLYVAPTMIVHYVQVHDYLPPLEFVKAVNNCPLPSSPEYREALQFAFAALANR